MKSLFHHPPSIFHFPPSIEDHDLAYRILCRLLSGPTEAILSPLSADDWRLLAATARREGVAPLLYRALNACPERSRRACSEPDRRDTAWPAGIPSDVQSNLRQAYYATAARNLLIYQELSRILASLATAGTRGQGDKETRRQGDRGTRRIAKPLPVTPSPPLPVILLKGAALAATLYPSIGLRPMGDVDLLVPKGQLDQAVAAVRALGYIPEGPEIRSGLDRLISYEVNLDGGEHIPLHVELHWNLIGGEESRYRPRINWFWSQTEEWKPVLSSAEGMDDGGWKMEDGVQLPSSTFHFPPSIFQLTPTAHLLYLAAHLALKHGVAHSPLRWFYDIHLLVTREGHRIDWHDLVLRAQEFRWAPALQAALAGATTRFATPLPAGLLESLMEGADPRDQALVQRKTRSQTRWERTSDALASLSWRARLHLLLAIVSPNPAYLRYRYNPRPVLSRVEGAAWLWPLTYPYRWLDILRDGLSTLWRMARRTPG